MGWRLYESFLVIILHVTFRRKKQQMMLNGQSLKQKLIVPSLRGPIRDLKSRS